MKNTMKLCVAAALAAVLAFSLTACDKPKASALALSAEGAWGGDVIEPELTPDMPEYHCREGSTHYQKGEYEKALECFQRALDIDPRYTNALHDMAITYKAMGRSDLAIEYYGEVIRNVPDYAQPYKARAELYQIMERFDDAEEDGDSYVKYYGRYANSYAERGDYFMAMREYVRAAEDYATAIEKGSTSEEVHVKYAAALLLSGDTKRAEEAFLKALVLADESN